MMVYSMQRGPVKLDTLSSSRANTITSSYSILQVNSAIGGVKNHTEITGHNCGFESLKTLTPDLAYHSAGGVKAEYRCSYLSIESQICNSPSNKKGSTANATSLKNYFITHCANNNNDNNTNLLFQKHIYLDAKLNEVFVASFEFLSCCTSITPVIKPLAKRDKTAKIIVMTTTVRKFIFSIINTYTLIQLLGLISRDCNSLRIIRLIQAAKDSSPSCCWACSIISRSSESRRNWNGGLPRLSFLCVDTSITPIVMCLCVITHYIQLSKKAMPHGALTLTGHLTTNDRTSIEVAMKNHITPVTGRDSFTPNIKFLWRFFSCQQSRYFTKVQPFGSIPCRNSSLRARSFSQLPRLTFSLSAAASNCSLNSGTSLILNIGDFPAPFGLLSLFTVDMYRPVEIVLMLLGLYTNTFNLDRTTPRSATNTIEASNHNVNWSNTMAMYKSTQTHPKFKWRFFSCQQSRYFTVEARSEQEARSMLPDAPCLFSARIRQGVNHA